MNLINFWSGLGGSLVGSLCTICTLIFQNKHQNKLVIKEEKKKIKVSLLLLNNEIKKNILINESQIDYLQENETKKTINIIKLGLIFQNDTWNNNKQFIFNYDKCDFVASIDALYNMIFMMNSVTSIDIKSINDFKIKILEVKNSVCNEIKIINK